MTIVVIGGTGLVGSKLVTALREQGHDVVPAAPSTGVDTLTAAGLDAAFAGATAVIDVSNAPSFEDAAVMEFFTTSTGNVLAAGQKAGVAHHVALSVVGTDRLQASGYFRAKLAQETLIGASGVPYSIVRATQFFEFLGRIADDATEAGTVRLAPVLFQPMAADDVAAAVARIAVGPPANGIVEVAGPDPFELDEIIRQRLKAAGDPRDVVSDPHARYYDAELGERTLLPGDQAQLAGTHLDSWVPAPRKPG